MPKRHISQVSVLHLEDIDIDIDSKAKKIQVLEYPQQDFSTQNISVLEQDFSAQNTFDERKDTKKTTKKTTQTKKQAPTKHSKQPLQKTVATIKPVFKVKIKILDIFTSKLFNLDENSHAYIDAEYREYLNEKCIASACKELHFSLIRDNKYNLDGWLIKRIQILQQQQSYELFEEILQLHILPELIKKAAKEIRVHSLNYVRQTRFVDYAEWSRNLRKADDITNYYIKRLNPNFFLYYLKNNNLYNDQYNNWNSLWYAISKNPNAHVFVNEILKLDTKKMQENIAPLRQELISYVWNPDRISRMASLLNMSFQEYLQYLG